MRGHKSILRRGLLLIWLVGFPHVVVAGESCSDGIARICLNSAERENAVTLIAVNPEAYDVTLTTTPKLKNMTSSVRLPDTRTLTGGFRQPIMTFTANPRGAGEWEYSFHWVIGALEARHDASVIYDLPFAGTRTVLQGFHGTYSHTGNDEYAVDWTMPVGTPIFAAREGVVVGAKSDSNQGGPDRKFADLGNFIFIRQADGTIAEYYHLRQGGAAVKVGAQVSRRQVIGYSGNTGFSSEPHLHFGIYRAIDGFKEQSFPMRFQTTAGVISPVQGAAYTARP
jgi:murein DD-endopeptidase MepM/ murein hydrolase activator NlpD